MRANGAKKVSLWQLGIILTCLEFIIYKKKLCNSYIGELFFFPAGM